MAEAASQTLSRGLRQRLAIAQAMVHDPKVLLLDEPAAGLDPEARHELSRALTSLRRAGMTLIVSSHILTELEDYSTDMLIIHGGRVLEHKPIGQAAAAAHHREQQAASRGDRRPALPTGTPQQIAQAIIGDDAQFQCFSHIVSHESGWSVTATNPSSGSYGLVQALPASKMASAGPDWRTNAATQIRWGLQYMNGRYGSPCAAWAFWQAHSWY